MDFLSLVQKRYSVRKYKPEPVAPELIDRCIEAARLAPSAHNAQPWKYIVITDEAVRLKVAKACSRDVKFMNRFVQQAPVLLVIIMEDPGLLVRTSVKLKNKEWPLIDIGITATHFCLQAAELGLGTCMVGWFVEKDVKEALGIPDSRTVGLIITLGHPAEDRNPVKVRKGTEEIRVRNRYGN